MRLFFWIFILVNAHLTYGQITNFEKFDDFKNTHLALQNDTTYLYNFWATWCKPCVEELPHFKRLADQYNQGPYKVVFVSLDSKKTTAKLENFVAEHLARYHVIQLTDNKYNDWLDKVDPSWSGSIPATLLLKGSKKEFYEKQFEDFGDLHTVWLQFFH